VSAGLRTRAGSVVAALALDGMVGEPPAPVHPVAAFGRVMARAEQAAYRDGRTRGTAYAGAGVALAAATGLAWESVSAAAARSLPARFSHLDAALAAAGATYLAVAGRALIEAAGSVHSALEAGDLPTARYRLRALAGRDPSGLDADEVARAVVESLAENTVDAVVAPVVWALAGGAPGVLAYRAINTLDAMVGHRSARYARFGWAAARSDDLANWVPARLTAALVALARPARAGAVWAAVRRQAPGHPSPNAGVAEAAFAAALGVRLGGVNVYDGAEEHRPALGQGRPARPSDIPAAAALSRQVTILLAGLALLLSRRPGAR